MLGENTADGSADQFSGNGVSALEFPFVFELQFASDGREGGVDVGDTGDDAFLAGASSALFGAAAEAFQSGDGQTLADGRAAIQALVLASLESDFFQDLTEIVRHIDLVGGIAAERSVLRGDGHSFIEGRGIVGANLRADAVFSWSYDFCARRVIFGIRGEDKKNIKRKAQGITLNLNVAFLHDVEEADLNFTSEIGQLIDGEDAAIGAREKAVMDGELVGEVASATGGANGIDIADNVGHGYVGGGKFFDEAILAGHRGDGGIVAFDGDSFAARAADRFQGIVVDFAAGDDGHFRIEKVDEAAENAALGLSAQAEKNEIVARKQGIDNLRDDGVFVAVNAGEERFALFDNPEQIPAGVFLSRTPRPPGIKTRHSLALLH